MILETMVFEIFIFGIMYPLSIDRATATHVGYPYNLLSELGQFWELKGSTTNNQLRTKCRNWLFPTDQNVWSPCSQSSMGTLFSPRILCPREEGTSRIVWGKKKNKTLLSSLCLFLYPSPGDEEWFCWLMSLGEEMEHLISKYNYCQSSQCNTWYF